jgi:signal transduction histidine kinase
VLADERRLLQILLNLLSNAIKFTDVGGTVSLAASRVGGEVHLKVRDSGMGISSKNLDLIFHEFTQVDAGVARAQEGTGLGLPLSRQLCELMGGEIRAASKVGVGSTFTVVLPAVSVSRQFRKATAV